MSLEDSTCTLQIECSSSVTILYPSYGGWSLDSTQQTRSECQGVRAEDAVDLGPGILVADGELVASTRLISH